MQKIFLCLCFATALFLHMPVQRANLSFFDGEYTFYSTEMQTPDGCTVLKNGNLYHFCCNSSQANKVCIKNVVGQSVRFAGTQNDFYLACKKLGKTTSRYQIENLLVAEGVSQKFGVLDGLDTNFQIAFDGRYITVGTPVIVGSF